MNATTGIALKLTDFSDAGDLRPGHLATALRGGIVCVWQAPSSAYLQVVVLSSGGAGPTAPDSLTCSVGGSACDASMTVNGYWVAWTWSNGPNSSTNNATLTAVGTALRAKVAAVPAPQFVKPSHSWKQAVDCAALASDSGLLAKVGGEGWILTPTDEPQRTLTANAPEWNSGQFTECFWSAGSEAPANAPGSASSIELNVLPGSAWYSSRVEAIAGAADVEIPGVQRAIRVPDVQRCSNVDPVPDPCTDFTLNAFDGVNWLQVVTDSVGIAKATSVIPSLLAALNARA